MTTELRLYTVNRGMMDSWLEAFQKHIMPTSARFGIKIHVAFINRGQNEFIWVRSYETPEALDAYMKSPDRAAYADETGKHIAKTEVRQVDLALGELSVANLAGAAVS
jgi:quinol monooxygenase YgiN